MSIVQFWWRFDSNEFASKISRLVRCGELGFAKNCIAYAGDLVQFTTGWESAVSNIGGWDKKSIADDFADPSCDSLNLAVLVLLTASCKCEVDPTGIDQCPIRIPISGVNSKTLSVLDEWAPPSTSSGSFVIPNDELIGWLANEDNFVSASVLKTAVEGDDLLCISSG